MAKFDIKSLLDSNRNGEEVNYDAVNAAIQEQVNGIVASNKPDMEKLKKEVAAEVGQAAVQDLFKKAGLTDVSTIDQFTAYVKTVGGSTDEAKEKAARLETELEALKTSKMELETKNQELSGQIDLSRKTGKLQELKFQDKYLIAARAEIEAKVTDTVDFDAAAELVKADRPEWLNTKDIGTQTPGAKDAPETEEEKAEKAKWLAEAGV